MATKKQQKKKVSRRSKAKYGALDPKYAPRVRKEYLDFDYLDQLNPEDKAWLNKFVEEELHASFKNNETDLNQTKEEKRKSYSNNNARNRDLYGITKVGGLMSEITDDYQSSAKQNHSEKHNLQEDAVIAEIDKKNK